MYIKSFVTLAVSVLLSLSFAACSSGRIHIREGSRQIGTPPPGTLFATDQATIVHVNEISRLATFRNANSLKGGLFFESKDAEGNKTGIFKVYEDRKEFGIKIAEILEGDPQINDAVDVVNFSELERLQEIYGDPVRESE